MAATRIAICDLREPYVRVPQDPPSSQDNYGHGNTYGFAPGEGQVELPAAGANAVANPTEVDECAKG